MTPIRQAINEIASMYKGHELRWVSENNPVAMSQINEIVDRIDTAQLAGDDASVMRLCRVWVSTWKFWIGAARI